MKNLDKVVSQYLVTALWSSTDLNDGTPLDENYSIEDFSKEAVLSALVDVTSFINKAGELLDGLDLTDIAHKFWLSRNRHGAGFIDGDYPKEIEDKLLDLAHSFGEIEIDQTEAGQLEFI